MFVLSWACLVGGVTNASPRREAKSLKIGYPLSFFWEGVHKNKQKDLVKGSPHVGICIYENVLWKWFANNLMTSVKF